jgi:hypothetical protein
MAGKSGQKMERASKRQLVIWLALALDSVPINLATGRLPPWARSAMSELESLGIEFSQPLQEVRCEDGSTEEEIVICLPSAVSKPECTRSATG